MSSNRSESKPLHSSKLNIDFVSELNQSTNENNDVKSNDLTSKLLEGMLMSLIVMTTGMCL